MVNTPSYKQAYHQDYQYKIRKEGDYYYGHAASFHIHDLSFNNVENAIKKYVDILVKFSPKE